MTFQLQAVYSTLGESKMVSFHLVSISHLGYWDENGNDVHAAVASSPVLHRALSSAQAAHEALRCLLVRGRASGAEAPCHGGPSWNHWALTGAPCLGCCWPRSYWGSSRTVGLKWLPLHLWCSERKKTLIRYWIADCRFYQRLYFWHVVWPLKKKKEAFLLVYLVFLSY